MGVSSVPTVVYPGSFDPVTLGHLDIMKRAVKIFGTLVVLIANNPSKKYTFSAEEREKFIIKALEEEGMSNIVKVEVFNGLLVDYVRKFGDVVIIRGLRAVTDFEYEFQMLLANRTLCKEFELIFLPASNRYLYLSSSIVKEIARFGGDISRCVPASIIDFVMEKLRIN